MRTSVPAGHSSQPRSAACWSLPPHGRSGRHHEQVHEPKSHGFTPDRRRGTHPSGLHRSVQRVRLSRRPQRIEQCLLDRFGKHQGPVSFWFSLLAFSAAMFAPIAIGVGRLSTDRWMKRSVRVGVAAAVVHDRASPLADPRPGLRRRRAKHRSADRSRRSGALPPGRNAPRDGRRRDPRLHPHRCMDGPRADEFALAFRRSSVRRARGGFGKSHRSRRLVTSGVAVDRHRELHRVHPLGAVAALDGSATPSSASRPAGRLDGSFDSLASG